MQEVRERGRLVVQTRLLLCAVSVDVCAAGHCPARCIDVVTASAETVRLYMEPEGVKLSTASGGGQVESSGF